jgi:hypothetical protein
MNRVHRGGQTECGAASYRRDRKSRLPSLVRALASGWQEIALRHSDLPPVLMGIGPSSRATAKRRCHAHFTPAAWSPVGPNASAALKASSRALEEAIARTECLGASVRDLSTAEVVDELGEGLAEPRDVSHQKALVAVGGSARCRGQHVVGLAQLVGQRGRPPTSELLATPARCCSRSVTSSRWALSASIAAVRAGSGRTTPRSTPAATLRA